MDWSIVPPMLTMFVTVVVAVAGGVWALVKWGVRGITDQLNAITSLINVRFQAVDQRFEDQNGRIDARFDAVDHRFDGLDKRVDGIDRLIDEVRVDIRAIVNRVDALQASTVTAAPTPE